MRDMRKVPGITGLLLVVAALAGGSVPSARRATSNQIPQQSQPPPTGLILGQVVDAGTGQPIAGAIVSLGGGPIMMNGQPLSPEDAAAFEAAGRGGAGGTREITGPVGQFVFHSLKKGSYRLSASAPGYIPGSYGQRRVNGVSKPIELDEGEHVGDATIKLWKYASISGRVTDDAGEPVVGIGVRILRAQVSGLTKTYPTAGAVQTDDRGVYRVATLVPGEYIVTVPQTVTTMPTSLVDAYASALSGGTTSTLVRQLSESNAPFPNFGGGGLRVGDNQISMTNGRTLPVMLSEDRREVFAFATTYYPSTSNSSDATLLKLASGQDQGGVDLQVRPVRTVTVSGTVTGSDGPVKNTGVRLLPTSSTGVMGDFGFETATTATDANGAFTFLGVPSGQYLLRVQRVPQPTFDNSSRVTIMSSSGGMTIMSSMSGDAPPPIPPTEPSVYGEMPVSVSDRDVQDLAVVLRAGARVSGKIVFEGAAAPPAPAVVQRMVANLSSIDALVVIAPSGRTTPDGQFTTSGYPPGRYFVNVGGAGTAGWTLQSLTLGGRNLDEMPLELSTSDVGGVVVTFTDHPTEIRGTVHAGSTAATATADLDATVVVFPSNYRDWIDHGMSARRQRTASVGKGGNFTVSGLPPGDYLAAAVNPEAIDSPRDPKTFDALARVASHFALTLGEKKSIDLTVVQIR
jgi:hypothetical protein